MLWYLELTAVLRIWLGFEHGDSSRCVPHHMPLRKTPLLLYE